MADMNSEGATSHQSENKIFTSIQYGRDIFLEPDVYLTPIGAAHNESFLVRNHDQLEKIVENKDFIGIEGNPDQLKNPVLYQDFQIFFNGILDMAWKHNKPVLHLDPENDIMIDVDLSITVAAIASATLPTILTIEQLIAKILGNNERLQMTRRDFLSALGTTALGAATFSSTEIGNMILNYANDYPDKPLPLSTNNPISYGDYRNTGIMVGIKRAAETGIIHGNGAYISGSSHLVAYEYYRKDPEKAEAAYKRNAYRLVRDKVIGRPPMMSLFTPTTSYGKPVFMLEKAIPLLK